MVSVLQMRKQRGQQAEGTCPRLMQLRQGACQILSPDLNCILSLQQNNGQREDVCPREQVETKNKSYSCFTIKKTEIREVVELT